MVVKSAPKEPEVAEVSVASTEQKESATKEELTSFSSTPEGTHAEAERHEEVSAPVPANQLTETNQTAVETSASSPPTEAKKADSHAELSALVQESKPIETKKADSHAELSALVQESKPIDSASTGKQTN